MDYGLQTGYYILTTAGTLSTLGAVKFDTNEEAQAKLEELNCSAYYVQYINRDEIIANFE